MHTTRFAVLVLALSIPLPLRLAAQSGVDKALAQQATRAGYTLAEAIKKSLGAAGHGQPYRAEMEVDKGTLVYSIDLAHGDKTINVVLDAKDGKVIENVTEDEDESALVKACKVSLATAIEAAVKQGGGQPIDAAIRLVSGKPVVDVMLFDAKAGAASTVRVDGVTAAVVPAAQAAQQEQAEDRQWTDVFYVDRADLGPTGRSTFMILEPGYKLTLQGKDGGQDVELIVSVLPETKQVDGVETRVVEERESEGGKLKEVSRNYFAISKKTSDVYYFGEDVDMYKDGKVVSHEGAWLSGQNGARFGIFLPGTPLLGARFYQEIAPEVAMDRAEIVSLSATVDTPSGKHGNAMKYEETTPLEKGVKEYKWFAPGIGLIQDAELKLVRIEK